MKHVVDLKKAVTVENDEGELTKMGMQIAHKYAAQWCNGFIRDLNLERQYPELGGLFCDIRTDPELAIHHAIPLEG